MQEPNINCIDTNALSGKVVSDFNLDGKAKSNARGLYRHFQRVLHRLHLLEIKNVQTSLHYKYTTK